MCPDPILGELLQHYGLRDFEAALTADEFGIDNLLQIKSEDDWNGFFEHFEVSGFLFKNRFKTLISAIPGVSPLIAFFSFLLLLVRCFCGCVSTA